MTAYTISSKRRQHTVSLVLMYTNLQTHTHTRTMTSDEEGKYIFREEERNSELMHISKDVLLCLQRILNMMHVTTSPNLTTLLLYFQRFPIFSININMYHITHPPTHTTHSGDIWVGNKRATYTLIYECYMPRKL